MNLWRERRNRFNDFPSADINCSKEINRTKEKSALSINESICATRDESYPSIWSDYFANLTNFAFVYLVLL